MTESKKYQVFVCSTYTDLQEERWAVIKALLELNCFPAGMEFFPSADDDQWTLIKRIIDECDYFIIIIGGRYGSITPEGISYIEKEYRYALEAGKPIMAFLHEDPDSLPKNKIELRPEDIEKLAAFKKLVQEKMCKFWKNADKLSSVVSTSLINLKTTNPARGWVRGDLASKKDESVENSELKAKIETLQRNFEEYKDKTVTVGAQEW